MSDSYAQQAEREVWEGAARSEVPPQHRTPVALATEPQVNYIRGLAAERDLSSLSAEQIAWIRADDFSKMSRAKASEVITYLKALPKATAQNANSGDLPDVAEGRYAVPNADGKLAFYIVRKPTEGRWKGFTFVDVMASDERHPIKGFAAKRTILAAIASDPDAGPRFGREIGSCYKCGRTLTDELSRSLGIGPVCRAD